MRALAALGFALASALAIVNLREIADAPTVDVPVPASAIRADGGVLRGTIRDGLPPSRLHWDGQPPSAVLVSASGGADVVLAAPAFSEETFAQNRNAVRFTDGEVRFTVDSSLVAPGTTLRVRCEAVPSRTAFTLWALVAIGMAAAGLLLTLLRGAWRHESRIRVAGSAIFVAIALAVFAGAYPGAAVRIAEDTDEAALASFAAARDQPEAFRLDKFLSEPSNYEWYTPAYVNAVRLVHRAGFHYQTSMAFFGLAGTLLYLFGLRRLFTRIMQRDDYALVATLAFGLILDQSAPPPGEFWSILGLLPRTFFVAFVPWIVLLALWALPQPRRWWVPCLAASLLVHIHPISTLVFTGALIVALIVASDEPATEKITGAALAAAAIALAMSPYVVTFVRHYGEQHNLTPAATARALDLIRGSFAGLRPGVIARDVLWHRLLTLRIVLDAIAVVLLLRSRIDTCVRFYLGIVIGFLLVTFGLPLVDAGVAEAFGRRQLAYELTRNVRYLDLLLACALAVGVRGWRGTRRTALALTAAGTLCAVFAFGPGWIESGRRLAGQARLSWRVLNGRPDAEAAAAQEAIRAVVALRAPDERVAGPQGLREFGVPLAWIGHDLVTLAYSVSPALVESEAVVSRAAPLFAAPLTEASLQQLSSILEAQLFLVRIRQLDPALLQSTRVRFRNGVYAVVK